MEANKAIELANGVFGFNGWSSTIVDMSIDYMVESSNGSAVSVGVSCLVRVTLRDGAYREDIGYGKMDNCRHRGQALEKAKKEATTDALKRCLRLFGNALGNCLYDKEYLKDVKAVPAAKNVIIPGSVILKCVDLGPREFAT